ncbi:hypothetical protein [Streptomyces sp. NPDC097619]|uniref:hypothetical protein n=1 Tax=Streptomyces sp. NPDC097619 TaxID=3157228 RepID=UPI003323652D
MNASEPGAGPGAEPDTGSVPAPRPPVVGGRARTPVAPPSVAPPSAIPSSAAPAAAPAPRGGQPGTEERGAPPEEGAAGTAARRAAAAEVGRFVVGAVTVLAALAGLVLGIRAELRSGREEQRVEAAERLAEEAREKVYADLVDFYWDGAVLHVVNGNSRVVPMRLALPDRKVFWDLALVKPCKELLVPRSALLASMAGEVPSVRLGAGELGSVRLEFMDPEGRVWERVSGRGLTRAEPWPPASRPPAVSAEEWNLRPEDSPRCGSS